MTLAAVLAALVVVGGVTAGLLANRASKPSLSAVQAYPEQRNHVTGTVDYPQTPPAGGDHNEVLLNCDVYDQPVPNENAVHDLEHGAVWIT